MQVDESVKTEAAKVLEKTYAGIDDFSVKSLTLNYFMITVQSALHANKSSTHISTCPPRPFVVLPDRV